MGFQDRVEWSGGGPKQQADLKGHAPVVMECLLVGLEC